MNKLFPLVKYSLINSLGINRFLKKRKGGKVPIIFVALFAILMFALFFFYMMMYGTLFNEVGEPGGILLFSIIFGSVMIAITSVSTVNGYLFNPKDFELLVSLPIKTKTIFISKVIDLLILNYVTMAYFYIPGIIVYSFFNNTNAIYWVLSILTFFIVPLLPVTVFGLIGYLFNLIKIDIRIKKMIRTIFTLAIVVLILVFSFSLSSGSEDMFKQMIAKMSNFYYIGALAYNGIRGNFLEYLLFIVISIVPFVLLIMFSGKTYLKHNSSNLDIYQIKSKEIKIKATSKTTTLLKKELKNYFLFPMYVVNTIVGPILSVIAVVFLSIRINANLVDLGNEEIISINDILPFLMITVITLTVNMSPLTPASISLEGKNMWIIKSSPIDYSEVKRAKLYTNYIVTIPFIIVDLIILIIIRDFLWYEYLLIGIIPIIMLFAIVKLGLLFNLLKPRFDYDNPIKAVKQGLPVLLSMGVSFLAGIIFLASFVLTYVFTSDKIISYIVLLIISLLIYLLSTILLNKKGRKCYNEIVC